MGEHFFLFLQVLYDSVGLHLNSPFSMNARFPILQNGLAVRWDGFPIQLSLKELLKLRETTVFLHSPRNSIDSSNPTDIFENLIEKIMPFLFRPPSAKSISIQAMI